MAAPFSNDALFVALGAVPGAWLRFRVVNHFEPMLPRKHWGTFGVNVSRLWGTLAHREKTSRKKKRHVRNGNSLIPRWPELMHPLRAPSALNSIRPRSGVAARVEETVAWRTSTVSSAKRCGRRSTEATRCG
jgi:hypothetical protein